MSVKTNEKRNEKSYKEIKKLVIKELLKFLAFAIVMITIYAIVASTVPVGIYWYWLNKTQLDSLYLFCYEVIFGMLWIEIVFCCCAARVKKCYFRKLNVLNKRVRSIHRRYEMSSIKIEDLK